MEVESKPSTMMLAREDLVTVSELDGTRVVRNLGTVGGSATRPQNMLRATFRTIGAFIGLAPMEYLTEAERAREDALEELRRKAEALGANAVVNLRFQADEGERGMTKVFAYGDAVVVQRDA